MVPTTRERTDELQALEELWAAPALGEKPERRARLPRVPGAFLVGGWLVFYFAVLPFEPEPAPGMSNPAWGTALVVTMIVTLLAAAAVGPALGLPVTWQDERYTSVSAEARIGRPGRGRAGGPPSSARLRGWRARIDREAATAILQSALDAQRRGADTAEPVA